MGFAVRDAYLLPEQPEVYLSPTLLKTASRSENPNDGFFWHTDASFKANPTAHTFLYCLETPRGAQKLSLPALAKLISLRDANASKACWPPLCRSLLAP
jgi:alpha-ketoglutarate-dependent taurine dioxygenase